MTVKGESSIEANYIRSWKAQSLEKRRDWRLNYINNDQDSIDKICTVPEFLEHFPTLSMKRNENEYTSQALVEGGPGKSAEMEITAPGLSDSNQKTWEAGFI